MRRFVILAATVVLPVSSLLLLGGPAAAERVCWTEEVVTANGIEKKRVCKDTDPGDTDPGGGGNGSGGPTGPVDTGPVTDVYHVPACSGNGPPGQSADALCGQAVNSTMCAEDEIFMRVYTRLVDRQTGKPVPGNRGEWSLSGSECTGPDEDPEGTPGGNQPPQITVEMVMDFARTSVPTMTVEMDPDNDTYVRVPNNFSVDSGAVADTLTVLGQAIPVTYTPTTYSWDFGDGGSGTGAGIANAAVGQPGAVEHAYLRSGEYEVTVTSEWSVTFTIPGQGQVTPPGTLPSTSEPYPVQVGEVQSVVTGVD